MTNGDIYRLFHERHPEMKPVDFRPLSYLHEPKGQGIQIWLENGDVILYFPKVEDEE